MSNWTEKDLEDYIWENPQVLGLDSDHYHHIARQYRLPNGMVVDIIGVEDGIPVIIELKAVAASGDALSQIMAYAHILATWYRQSTGQLVFPRSILAAPNFDVRTVIAAQRAMVELRFVHLRWTSGETNAQWLREQASGDGDAVLFGHFSQTQLPAINFGELVQEALSGNGVVVDDEVGEAQS